MTSLETKSPIFSEIRRELTRAEELHPGFPDDMVHRVAIMTEEAGEALRAALNYYYHGGSGSICIACHDMGFDLDWIELDADYYNAAVERYQRHAAQTELFQFEGREVK